MKTTTVVAAMVALSFSRIALGQTYVPVPEWPSLPDGRETLGPMHGDVAVSAAGDVYVSVETEGAGVDVFTADGRYLRSLANAPADLHGFVIRDAGDGEYLYGVSLRGQKVVKMTLDGEVVLEITRDAIPRNFWTENRFSDELGVLLSGMDVAPNGDLYVADGYSSDFVHRFDADGRYRDTFGGKAAPYGFDILHKIAMDTRFDPVRIIATDRLNNRVVHLGLDGEFLGVVNDELLLPAALTIHGDHVIVGELQGRVTILDKEGDIVAHVGTNTEEGIGSNQVPPDRWRTGFIVAAHGVATSAAGDLYVAEFSRFGRVHKFEPGPRPRQRTVRSALTEPAVGDTVPQFIVDPFWPKPLPNDWILGQVAGVDVDDEDHVWIVQRPRSLSAREIGASQQPPISKCCDPAPPVLEFDPSGNLLQAWGGPGQGYEWPVSEHGIRVADGFVWLAGNGEGDSQVLKFTRAGEFVLQIGRAGRNSGSHDLDDLGRPADIVVDVEAGEVYVADGYGNRRVIVFDAETGEYKRHWGAYGNRPHDEPLPPYDPSRRSDQFASPVHCIELSHEGLVYVCDRANNRYQVFSRDGSFVSEAVFEPSTLLSGSVSDLVLSNDPGQRYVYMVDGTNNELRIVDRRSTDTLARIGRPGRYAGQFHVVHDIAIDSGGNLYTTEVNTGQRVQKFRRLDQ